MNVAELVDRLDKVRGGRDGQYQARCPAHQDRGPSLSVKDTGDGRILLHCFAGCETENVLAAIGLSFSDVMPERIGDKHSFAPFIDRRRIVAVLAHELTVAQIILERSWGASTEDNDRLAEVSRRIRQAQQVFPDKRTSPELKAIGAAA